MPDRASPRHFALLDARRALAALMIVLTHAPIHAEPVAGIQAGLRAGVVVFFVLSGFLLFRPFAAGLRGGRAVDLREFVVRRLARILPAYLLATFGLAILLGDPGPFADPIGALLMLNTPIAVVWSLQVELVFYAVLPLLFVGLRALPPQRRLPLVVAIGIASFVALLVETVALATGVTGAVPPYAAALFTFWQFTPGMVVAWVAVSPRGLPRAAASPLFAILAIATLAIGVVMNLQQYDVVTGVASGLLVAAIVARPAPSPRASDVFALLGGMSYAIYLWHHELDALFAPAGPVAATAMAFVATLLIAFLSWRLVEQPAMALAQRLTTRRRPVAPLLSAGAVAPAD